MKRNGLKVLIILCAVSLLINGCAFKDIDKRFFVVSVAVDEPESQEKNYKITIKLAIPSPEERFGSNNFLLMSEETNSLAEAVRLMKSKVDKELDFGHVKVIIFGEKLVQQGNMSQLLDWFIRRRDIQKIAWVGIGSPSGKAVLSLKPKSERLPSNMIMLSFGQTGTETAYIVSEYLFDFRRRLTERGLDPILPVIKVRQDQQIAVNEVAIFDKDKRKITLTPEETKFFNSFYERVGKYDIFVNQGNSFFVISAQNVRGAFSFKKKDGKPYIRVSMKINGVIEESNMSISTRDLPMYEEMAKKTVQERVQKLLKKLQEADVDPIGFGLRYRARHIGDPDKVWQDWIHLYPNLDFEIDPKVTLVSTGATG